MSPLTPATTGGNLRRKELKNSERSGIRTRQICGFFVPVRFLRREGDGYNTRKGKKSRRLRSVLNLPASRRARVRTFPLGFNNLTQERFMARTKPAAKAAKPRAAKPEALPTNVILFPDTTRERARARRRFHCQLHEDVFARAAKKGWKFIPPASEELMRLNLMLRQEARDALVTLAKALCANKDNWHPMYR